VDIVDERTRRARARTAVVACATVIATVSLTAEVPAGAGHTTGTGHGDAPGGARPALGKGSIVFFSLRAGNDDVYVTDLGGGHERRLTTHPAVDPAPAASPDRRTIAFAAEREGLMQLYLMDADGSDQHPLLKSGSFDYWPSWAPDGTRVLFQRRDAAGQFDLWSVGADGTDQRRLTSLPRNEIGGSYAPDGSTVVFSGNNSASRDVWVVPGAGGAPRVLTADACIGGTDPCVLASDVQPSWTPDGDIVFVSDRSGGNAIWTMRADGSAPKLVRDFGTASIAMPSVSENGQWITFVTDVHDPGGERNVHVMRADGSHLRQLADTGDDLAPRFAGRS